MSYPLQACCYGDVNIFVAILPSTTKPFSNNNNNKLLKFCKVIHKANILHIIGLHELPVLLQNIDVFIITFNLSHTSLNPSVASTLNHLPLCVQVPQLQSRFPISSTSSRAWPSSLESPSSSWGWSWVITGWRLSSFSSESLWQTCPKDCLLLSL